MKRASSARQARAAAPLFLPGVPLFAELFTFAAPRCAARFFTFVGGVFVVAIALFPVFFAVPFFFFSLFFEGTGAVVVASERSREGDEVRSI